MALNRYPVWKNWLLIAVALIALLYAMPNFFGEDPAVQITRANVTAALDNAMLTSIKTTLKEKKIAYKSLQINEQALLIRFANTDLQLKAKENLQDILGNDYLVALNLAPATPRWLNAVGAAPMKYGLDLRGGVYFLLQVDIESVLKQRIEGDIHRISQALRDNHIRYTGLTRQNTDALTLTFNNETSLTQAVQILRHIFPEFMWTTPTTANSWHIKGQLSPVALQQIRQDTLEQAMNTLRNRVNELGVSEAVVQQQGATRVAVDLPGIQDTAQAKNILGKTATLEFRMVDTEHDVRSAINGMTPPGTQLYNYSNNQPILLSNTIILRGSSITSAISNVADDGRPSVNVRLGGGGESLFNKMTAENVGKPMAVVYVEVKSTKKNINGQEFISYQTEKKIISIATIQSALGNNFQITGLANADEARNLALLLRAGALPAPVTIIEERQVGPSLGKKNIQLGVLSVAVGFGLVVVFMALYYGVLGIIADIALGMNLVLIVALLSMLGGTLTLPGIAGMVLTVGMAADANVLIFERIREELRNGMSISASIHAGYERALVTIVDANITTLIVAIVLFSLGSGAVKAFAITLTIGLMTSMFTAITGTRAVVNALYGRSQHKKISIGI